MVAIEVALLQDLMFCARYCSVYDIWQACGQRVVGVVPHNAVFRCAQHRDRKAQALRPGGFAKPLCNVAGRGEPGEAWSGDPDAGLKLALLKRRLPGASQRRPEERPRL